MGPEEVNVILKHLDSGVDKALQRAKVWSKYLKDIIYYIDKKAQLGEYVEFLPVGKLNDLFASNNFYN